MYSDTCFSRLWDEFNACENAFDAHTKLIFMCVCVCRLCLILVYIYEVSVVYIYIYIYK